MKNKKLLNKLFQSIPDSEFISRNAAPNAPYRKKIELCKEIDELDYIGTLFYIFTNNYSSKNNYMFLSEDGEITQYNSPGNSSSCIYYSTTISNLLLNYPFIVEELSKSEKGLSLIEEYSKRNSISYPTSTFKLKSIKNNGKFNIPTKTSKITRSERVRGNIISDRRSSKSIKFRYSSNKKTAFSL